MGESARSGKTIGIDLGAKRIGVALSDSNGTMAFPLATVERSGDDSADRSRLIDLVEESGSRTVVVGLPLTLRGTQGPAADLVRVEVVALRADLEPAGVEVHLFDERLTTVSAQRALAAAGKRGRRARAVVDQSAAAVLLQAWLDAQ